MMKFSYDSYRKEFDRRMRELEKAFKKGDVLKTVCYIKYLSWFYYSINYKFADDRLEQITKEISQKYLSETVIEKSRKGTVLFYDNFGVVERGLANIYVKALEKLGYSIVWVLYSYAPELKDIQDKYKDRDKITFRIIPKKTILERMKILQELIKEIAPEHIFIYTTPEDADGIGVISTVKGDVNRYLIDLTDHAFWLGKCAVDWVIGFRNFGYNVAVQYRGIAADQMILLPYYPEPRDGYAFEGLPFDTEKQEFIFSGGSPYKIENSSIYKEMVQYILKKYVNMRFVFAGNGTNSILEDLRSQFPDRFFHIEERRDLDEILKRAKFYLSTYPISGGLMIQYALQNRCIPLTLCDEKDGESDPKTWLLNPEKVNFVFYKKEDIFIEIDCLLQEEQYYLEKKNNAGIQVISEDDFRAQLGRALTEKKTMFSGKLQDINIDRFLDIYKKNATYEKYCRIIYESRNKWVYKRHPLMVRRAKFRTGRSTGSGVQKAHQRS